MHPGDKRGIVTAFRVRRFWTDSQSLERKAWRIVPIIVDESTIMLLFAEDGGPAMRCMPEGG